MKRTRRNHSPKVKAAAAFDCQTPDEVYFIKSLKDNVA
jgi:hypothetical protein